MASLLAGCKDCKDFTIVAENAGNADEYSGATKAHTLSGHLCLWYATYCMLFMAHCILHSLLSAMCHGKCVVTAKYCLATRLSLYPL